MGAWTCMTHSKLLSYYKIILMRNAETFADRILFSSGKNLFGVISHKILPARQLGHYFQPYRHIVLIYVSRTIFYYLIKTINFIKQTLRKTYFQHRVWLRLWCPGYHRCICRCLTWLGCEWWASERSHHPQWSSSISSHGRSPEIIWCIRNDYQRDVKLNKSESILCPHYAPNRYAPTTRYQ